MTMQTDKEIFEQRKTFKKKSVLLYIYYIFDIHVYVYVYVCICMYKIKKAISYM